MGNNDCGRYVRLADYALLRGLRLNSLRGLVRQSGAALRAVGRLRPDRLYEYDVEALDEFVARVCPKSGRRKNCVRPPAALDAARWCPFRPGDVVRVTNARGESRVGRITRVCESLGRMELASGEETVFARDAIIEASDGPLSASDFGMPVEESRFAKFCRLIQPCGDRGRRGRWR